MKCLRYLEMKVPHECRDEEAIEFLCKPAANALKADLDECDRIEEKGRLSMVLEFKNLHEATAIANWDQTIPHIKNAAQDPCKKIQGVNVIRIVNSEKDEDSPETEDHAGRILSDWNVEIKKFEHIQVMSI